MDIDGLTPKQRGFVREYLVDTNSRQAALHAGYSVRSVKTYAHILRRKPAVATAIARAQDSHSTAIDIAVADGVDARV
jgi:phage terminase small subunit